MTDWKDIISGIWGFAVFCGICLALASPCIALVLILKFL